MDVSAYLKKIKKMSEKQPKDADKELLGRLYAPFREHKEEIAKLAERDFSPLENLPAVGGVPRTVKIAEFLLTRSRYLLSEERLGVLMDAVTAKVTPSFEEIRTFPLAFEYCLVKKLALTADSVKTMADIAGRARKAAARPAKAVKSADFRILKKNAVFNTVCAGAMGYEGKNFVSAFGELADETVFYTENVFVSLSLIPLLDFLRYYKPLKIVAKYELMKSCDEKTITNYFNSLSRLSEKENLDETAYALRLESYLETGMIPPLRVRNVRVGGRLFSFASEKESIVTLARALTSEVAMNLYFGGADAKGKVITERTLKAPLPLKNKDFCVDFGISSKNGALSVNPSFPPCVKQALIVFEHDGTEHRVTVEKGMSRVLTVNGTAMFGVPTVKLGSVPLEITVGIPKERDEN